MTADPHNGNIFTLCDIVRETGFEIYKYLSSGHRENIYENALAHHGTHSFRNRRNDVTR